MRRFSRPTSTTHLRALLAVHDFRSVQRAAPYLSVSRPAISYSIKQIENDLGIALSSRLPNGMIPTPSGISLAVHARRILAELSKMVDDARSVEGEASGLARIGGLAYSRTALLLDGIDVEPVTSDPMGLFV